MRKTAAVCVAKLHDINSQLVEDQGFLDLLKELLSDSTPMVVANAVAALAEIGDISPTGVLNKLYFMMLKLGGILQVILVLGVWTDGVMKHES